MVGLSLSAPETSQVKMLPVCPTVRDVLKFAVTMTVMGGAVGIKILHTSHNEYCIYISITLTVALFTRVAAPSWHV